jgi:pimeloyl-ACP methyl ester carboxylesterase
MRYWVSAPSTGIPIVLLHGFSSLLEHWNRTLPYLTPHHTCYALDLYGFGHSAQLPDVPPLDLWTGQVEHFLHEVVGEPAVLVGNSLGGMVAAQLARDAPALVRGVVLVDAIGLPNAADFYPLAERLFYRIIQVPHVGEAMAGVLGGSFGVLQFLHVFYHRWQYITANLVEALSGPLCYPGAALFRLGFLRAMQHFTLDIAPGDVTAPTLLLWGMRDKVLPPAIAHQFQRQMFPAASLKFLPDAGHCPFDETPELFCAILLTWLQQGIDDKQRRVETSLPRKETCSDHVGHTKSSHSPAHPD